MAEDHRETRFDKTVTLEDIREKIELFAKERDWDQVYILAMLMF